jgi:hypothetical protein
MILPSKCTLYYLIALVAAYSSDAVSQTDSNSCDREICSNPKLKNPVSVTVKAGTTVGHSPSPPGDPPPSVEHGLGIGTGAASHLGSEDVVGHSPME